MFFTLLFTVNFQVKPKAVILFWFKYVLKYLNSKYSKNDQIFELFFLLLELSLILAVHAKNKQPDIKISEHKNILFKKYNEYFSALN